MAFKVRSILMSAPKVQLIEVTKKGPIAILAMQRPPVNSFNTSLLTSMHDAIRELEGDQTIGSLVLCSSSSKAFSAGLELTEMYKYKSIDQLKTFWRAFQDCWLALHTTRLWTIAAIGGHATAGGCGMALCCDYRIGAQGPFQIGLNEANFGLIPPHWFIAPMQKAVGHRLGDQLLKRGLLLPFNEAHRIGLLDELCAPEELMQRAEEEATKWLSPNESVAAARYEIKQTLRQSDADVLLKDREADEKWFLDRVTTPQIQKNMEVYIKALAGKKR